MWRICVQLYYKLKTISGYIRRSAHSKWWTLLTAEAQGSALHAMLPWHAQMFDGFETSLSTKNLWVAAPFWSQVQFHSNWWLVQFQAIWGLTLRAIHPESWRFSQDALRPNSSKRSMPLRSPIIATPTPNQQSTARGILWFAELAHRWWRLNARCTSRDPTANLLDPKSQHAQ